MATVEEIKAWTMTYSQTPHKASSPGTTLFFFFPSSSLLFVETNCQKGLSILYLVINFILGILCLELHPSNQDLVMTGGMDKTAVVLNRRTGRKDV